MNMIDMLAILAAHAAHQAQEQERAYWEGARLNRSETDANELLAMAVAYSQEGEHPYEDAAALALYVEQADQHRAELRRRAYRACALD